jgi:hypothetical protein
MGAKDAMGATFCKFGVVATLVCHYFFVINITASILSWLDIDAGLQGETRCLPKKTGLLMTGY